MPAFAFLANPRPKDADGIWDRLVKLVRSMSATDWIPGVALKAGAEGNLIPHNQTTAPKFFTAHLVGTTASSAIVTRDPTIGPSFVKLYTTIACTVDIELRL
jgi:hypothetical protein